MGMNQGSDFQRDPRSVGDEEFPAHLQPAASPSVAPPFVPAASYSGAPVWSLSSSLSSVVPPVVPAAYSAAPVRAISGSASGTQILPAAAAPTVATPCIALAAASYAEMSIAPHAPCALQQGFGPLAGIPLALDSSYAARFPTQTLSALQHSLQLVASQLPAEQQQQLADMQQQQGAMLQRLLEAAESDRRRSPQGPSAPPSPPQAWTGSAKWPLFAHTAHGERRRRSFSASAAVIVLCAAFFFDQLLTARESSGEFMIALSFIATQTGGLGVAAAAFPHGHSVGACRRCLCAMLLGLASMTWHIAVTSVQKGRFDLTSGSIVATAALCASIFQEPCGITLIALLFCWRKDASLWALYRPIEGCGMCVSLLAKFSLRAFADLPAAPSLHVSFACSVAFDCYVLLLMCLLTTRVRERMARAVSAIVVQLPPAFARAGRNETHFYTCSFLPIS